jgi:hypothetical protein
MKLLSAALMGGQREGGDGWTDRHNSLQQMFKSGSVIVFPSHKEAPIHDHNHERFHECVRLSRSDPIANRGERRDQTLTFECG